MRSNKRERLERLKRLANYVIYWGESDFKLNEVLPFPIRSGIFSRLTKKQVGKYLTGGVSPNTDYQAFDTLWDRVAAETLHKMRKRWWKRLYLRCGRYRWPRL